MADNAYLRWMRDPDAVARREEFAAFAGPRAAAYVAIYDRMHAAANRAPGEKVKFSLWGNGFNVGAFFVGPVWFFYRKMWWWGIGVTVLMLAIGWLPIGGRPGLWIGAGLAVGVNQLYVAHAIAAMVQMKQVRGLGDARLPEEALRAAGGVSKTAGWVGGAVYVLLLALVVAALVLGGGRSM